jgi:hypothetical protein
MCQAEILAYFPFAGLSFQRAAAAVRATSERCSGVSFVIRAFAPRLPSATAAGFFLFAINHMLSAQPKKCKYSLDMLSTQHLC